MPLREELVLDTDQAMERIKEVEEALDRLAAKSKELGIPIKLLVRRWWQFWL